jgi:hypothetical protein
VPAWARLPGGARRGRSVGRWSWRGRRQAVTGGGAEAEGYGWTRHAATKPGTDLFMAVVLLAWLALLAAVVTAAGGR